MSPSFKLRLSALFLGIALITAWVSFAVPDENKNDLLNKADAALNDELYDLAEQNIRQYLNASNNTKLPQPQAMIMLARALHGQKRYQEMLALLAKNQETAQNTPWADNFAFWLAVANYENNQLAQTLEQTTAFENNYPTSQLMNDNLRLRAKTLLKLNRDSEAISILQKIIKEHEDNVASANDRLVLGQIFAKSGKVKEAGDILEKLLSYPPESNIGQKCRIILGRVYLEEKEWTKARSIYDILLKQNNIPSEYRLQAIESLSEIAAAQTDFGEALGLLENAYQNTLDPSQKDELSLHKGMLLIKMNRTDEGIPLIHNYVNAQTNNIIGAGVQFELAQTLLNNGLNEKALLEFQNFLETFASRPESSEAYSGKGTALCRLGRYHEAVAAFDKAVELGKNPDEKNQYRYRSADALFASGQYSAAAEIYAKIANTTSNTHLGRLALLQTAECFLQIGNTTGAETVLWSLYDDDPPDALSSRALLRLADIYLQRNQLQAAETIYTLINDEYGDLLQACAIHGLGMIAYRAGRYDEALRRFEQVLKNSKDREVAAAAAYMSAWSLAMMSKWDEARQRFSLVVNSYGRSAKAPEALFWLGEFDYNCRRFDSAEASFRMLADKYPQAACAEDALFWAGRAALNQNEFKRARDYFSALIKRYPSGKKRPDARYFQGIALCELGQFDAAILIFNEIIKQYPEHELMESAAFKKADCQFMLGSDDPKRYEEALNTYQFILDQPLPSFAARLQARYKMGRCLEKLGKTNEAFAQYLQVVYLYMQNQDQSPAGNLWFSRAAFNAAGIMEEKQSWRKAANIYERVVEADIPASRAAQERIEKLRSEHWLSFY